MIQKILEGLIVKLRLWVEVLIYERSISYSTTHHDHWWSGHHNVVWIPIVVGVDHFSVLKEPRFKGVTSHGIILKKPLPR